MPRLRKKSCALCRIQALTLLRVQHDRSGTWIFVCPNCWQEVSKDNPFYKYGGTWKAQKLD